MNRRALLVHGICAAAISGAGAAEPPPGAIVLNGEEIRLIDVIAPDFPKETAPRDAAALYARRIGALLAGANPQVEDKRDRDRWNRRVAVLRMTTGETLQELLVGEGLARVRPESDDDGFIDRLLLLERLARDEKRGLWNEFRYRVHDASDARRAVGRFNLVEGAPLAGALRKGRAYLNFGEDFRTDFTATAPSRSARKWAKTGLDFTTLAGRSLRLRGHVAWINGPSVEITHSKQIEILA